MKSPPRNVLYWQHGVRYCVNSLRLEECFSFKHATERPALRERFAQKDKSNSRRREVRKKNLQVSSVSQKVRNGSLLFIRLSVCYSRLVLCMRCIVSFVSVFFFLFSFFLFRFVYFACFVLRFGFRKVMLFRTQHVTRYRFLSGFLLRKWSWLGTSTWSNG